MLGGISHRNRAIRIASTNNPSDAAAAPETVISDSDGYYTIEDILTTGETISSNTTWFFNGWYYDKELTEQASGTITLSAGVTTLYGGWLITEPSIELVKIANVEVVENAC